MEALTPTSCTKGQTFGDPRGFTDSSPLTRDGVLHTFSEVQSLLSFNSPWGQLKVPGEAANEHPADSSPHWTLRWLSHVELLTFPHILSHLDEAQQDDEGQGQQLGSSKGILHTGSSLHAVAVHSRE